MVGKVATAPEAARHAIITTTTINAFSDSYLIRKSKKVDSEFKSTFNVLDSRRFKKIIGYYNRHLLPLNITQ